MEVNARFNWRDCKTKDGAVIVPEAQDQGETNCCMAYAASACLLSRFRLHDASERVPSDQWVKTLSVQQIVDGTEMGDGAEMILKEPLLFGITTKDFYPTGSNLDLLSVEQGAPWYRFDKVTLPTPGCNEQLAKEILLNGPVIAIIPVCEDFEAIPGEKSKDLYRAASRAVRTPDGKVETHAVVLIGWVQEDGDYSWYFLNSYGPHWGDEGVGRILMSKVIRAVVPRIVTNRP